MNKKIIYGASIFLFCATIFFGTVSSASARTNIPGLAQVENFLGGLFDFFKKPIPESLPLFIPTSHPNIIPCDSERPSRSYLFVRTQAGPICREYFGDNPKSLKYNHLITNASACREFICGNNNGSNDNKSGDDASDNDPYSPHGSCPRTLMCGDGTKEVDGVCVISSSANKKEGKSSAVKVIEENRFRSKCILPLPLNDNNPFNGYCSGQGFRCSKNSDCLPLGTAEYCDSKRPFLKEYPDSFSCGEGCNVCGGGNIIWCDKQCVY